MDITRSQNQCLASTWHVPIIHHPSSLQKKKKKSTHRFTPKPDFGNPVVLPQSIPNPAILYSIQKKKKGNKAQVENEPSIYGVRGGGIDNEILRQ
jgi:hypothetical protein